MATGVARSGGDIAGGVLQSGSNTTVRCNGLYIAVYGTPVNGHGDSPHSRPRMVTASATVRVGSIGVCRAGDVASCGHITSGSPNVRAGG